MIFVCVSDDHPDKILFRLLDETQIRQEEIDARQVLVGETNADVDHKPLACARRPIPIEGAIHPNLAQAAKRDEDQLVVVRHLSAPFRRMGDGRNHSRLDS